LAGPRAPSPKGCQYPIGAIAPVIGQIYALEEAGSTHAAIGGRAVFGKTLLTMT
jgi:NADPH:quinone reductase-like Zn-dependent oxidoreductase